MGWSAWPLSIASLLLPLLVGCDGHGGLGPNSGDVRSAAALPAEAPLAWHLSVELDRPAPVTVVYRADGGPAMKIEALEPRQTHDLLLARLRPDRLYDYEVRSGPDGHPVTGSFRTAPLPPGLAGLSFEAAGAPTHPLVILDVQQTAGFGGLVVVDAAGEIVWYLEVPGGVLGSRRRENGNFALISRATGVLEVSVDGTVVGSLPNDPSRRAHHDLVEHQGALLVLATDRRPWNDTMLAGEAVWRWTGPGATATRIWSSWDHLTPAVDWSRLSYPDDWLHANSLSVGPRGNLVISLHFLDQVVSFDHSRDVLEWRFGGLNATVPAPEGEIFTGQHTASEPEPNRVLMFDNGRDRTQERFSRAVAFELEPAGRRSSKAWEFRASPDNWARALSLARALPAGNTFVHFGGGTGPIVTYEVRPDGSVAWRMTTRGLGSLYRVSPSMSLAGEEEVKPSGQS
jgi:hypothetical protein